MEIKHGISVSPGVAISPAMILDAEEYRIHQLDISPEEIPAHIALIDEALESSSAEIGKLRESYTKRLGAQTAAIFEFHQRVLSDEIWRQKLKQMIEERRFSAAHAVSIAMRDWERQLRKARNRVFQERIADVHDIEKRLLRHVLKTRREDLAHLTEEVVIIAHDLTPSQAASLDESKAKGFALDAGGRTSHTAIVARSLGLPAVVGLNDVSTAVTGGDLVIIDGNHGVVIINPDETTLSEYRLQKQRFIQFESELDELRELPATMSDGPSVTLLANIEFPWEVATSMEKGAAGIGLYRTEYLFLSSNRVPDANDHYQAYKTAIESCGGKPIVIRTLDLGADKLSQDMALSPEPNPFLGCRSIRYCLQNLPMFKAQLRAILRACRLGEVHIMFPLVTNVMEIQQAKTVMADVLEDLEEEGVPFGRPQKIGVMIETPAAALTAGSLSDHVDFFSIGTNDLVQYCLAVDRGNERVAHLFSASHPAVLKLIRDVVRVSRRKNVDVAVCGEMAGDPLYTLVLLGLGLRKLSMVPTAIPEIKKLVRSVSAKQAERVAQRVMSFSTIREVNNYMRDQSRKLLPELF
jgi:phosphotransferase system enzyme I (PtsI)